MATATLHRYENPFLFDQRTKKPKYEETEKRPLHSYRGFLIFKRHDRHYDFVFNGVCITQLAGVSRYKEAVDDILAGVTPLHNDRAQAALEAR